MVIIFFDEIIETDKKLTKHNFVNFKINLTKKNYIVNILTNLGTLSNKKE